MNKELSEKIKNELTIEQVYELITSLGGNPQIKNDIIISQTICHGGQSHKLYYYENTHLFRCFTDCPEDAFDIYQLIMKIKKLDNIDFSLPQAINFIVKYFNLKILENTFEIKEEKLEDWKILNNYDKINSKGKEEKIIDLKFYDESILKFLPHPHIEPWEKEGIKREVMEDRGICYDPVAHGIVIPHYDIDNNLVGIRERTLIKENEEYGKYRPAVLNYKMYNHPLGYNLYNLNKSKENIKKIKKVIVFEGEKSPLLYASYFGMENDITVAVCGSSLIQYQVDLLLNLGVQEIIIAFDRQFQTIGDEEWKKWTEKLKNIKTKYGNKVNISFIFDKWNLLDYKMSPIDNGKDVFLELFKRRIMI